MLIQPARKFERGQALPLLVLALLALAGFAALALDGGNLWTEQRRAQAAADNAVMAAAYQQMNGVTDVPTLQQFALANAAQNGYVPGSATKVVYHLPPVDGPYTGNPDYMEVVITQTVPTALAHLIYRQDPIPVTVIAVAHGIPSGPTNSGFAIAAMKPDCPNSNSTIYLQGNGGGSNGGTFLTNGGAFVNANCPDALDTNGQNEVLYTNGTPVPPINIAGTSYSGDACTAPGVPTGCNFYPAPTTGVPQVPQDPLAGTPAATLPDAYCQTLQNLSVPNSGPVVLQPGNYTSLDSGNRDMTLTPGIYCLKDGTLTSGNGNLFGRGVLIYLQNAAAQIVFSGQGNLDLEAPTDINNGNVGGFNCVGNTQTSPPICAYLGIVVYKVTGTNQCLDNQANTDVVFTGNATMNVVGLVYAPYSLVKYGGNGNLTMTGQTIAGCVKFNGNGQINIIYNPNATYSPPPLVRLVE